MEHLARIQRTIDYIEEHLTEELSTEALAKVACFSMWHFQQVFSSAVGDSLKEYIRRRRLTLAMRELTTSDRRILDIALDCQFESQEAFTRAFKTAFGITPGECRRQRVQSILPLSKPRITIEYLDHLYGGMTMKPEIVTTSEKKVVGVGSNFISVLSPEKNNHLVIPKLWDAYMARAHEIKNRVTPADLGLCEALPEAAAREHKDEFHYIAGTEAHSFDDVPKGMIAKTVPAGRYARFIHKGTLDKLPLTMNYIYGSWLPKSGEELRDAPDLEVYGPKFAFGSEHSELEILIPIRNSENKFA